MSRVFISPLATPFHSLVSIFPIPSRYISIFRAPPPRYFSPSLIKEAALSLEVTPQITPDNRIIVEVKVTKDAPDFQNALNGVPPINKNEVNAKILVNDGETIVIGGVFSNTQTKAVDKVPFLGDLPYLGRLFRRDTVSDTKNELLVFLTPRIMNNQAIAIGR